jgi:CrcB protein
VAGPFSWRIAGLLVVGGAVGTLARFTVTALLARPGLPWGTLAVNFSGSFLLGTLLFSGILGRDPLADWRVLLGAGFFGAYTTMSAFAVETVALAAEGAYGLAAVNALLNPFACVAGAAAGLGLSRIVRT